MYKEVGILQTANQTFKSNCKGQNCRMDEYSQGSVVLGVNPTMIMKSRHYVNKLSSNNITLTPTLRDRFPRYILFSILFLTSYTTLQVRPIVYK